ncbi:hypothetical protein GE061_010719 [Apolygus lucorum]|uniref:Uncharacterized protein n=1 Tax=Apolygus lucorum TaxID=248454 RepID=A0A8S9XZH9_APOLU|nr:hypothetical protein GE061_010719 [Apolygus lucorum]
MRSEALSSSTTYKHFLATLRLPRGHQYPRGKSPSFWVISIPIFTLRPIYSSLESPAKAFWSTSLSLYLGSLYLLTSALNSSNSNQTLRNIGRGGSGREAEFGTKDDNRTQIQAASESNVLDGDGSKIQKELDEAMKELELAERLAVAVNTRESRGLLKKVAFLAGMRVGGLVQSSGTLAASNSFRVFGKVVNSALSVSYGSIDELNKIPGIESEIENPHTLEDPSKVSTKVVSAEGRPLSIREAEEEAHRRIKSNFLSGHNELVERANANSKFLRISRAQELSDSSGSSDHS